MKTPPKNTLNLQTGVYIAAPSDAITDHLCMLKGLVETLSALCTSESQTLDPEDLGWTFILMGELIRHLEEDVELVDERFRRITDPKPRETERQS